MEITEVRIKLMDEPGERLQAFCSITFDDCFVIRDLKIIEGANGPFVAMPSRKLTSHCPQCGSKNHLRANFCNECGAKLNPNRAPLDEDGRAKLYADIAHPINSMCREAIQDRVIREFREEQERAKQPGYVSRYDDFDIDDYPAARGNRGAARNHPTTNYARLGSERSPRAQNSQPGPRGPHRTSVKSPSHHLPARDVPPSNDDGGSCSDKLDEFGAGIF
ncbi:MAG: septation protein SpoVG family protein [Pirellulales bacterium]|nr:septation protein SpoVG family protein [Pirellulales bacterium]